MACESSVIYRRRNLGAVNIAAVADLVLLDAENPRSLVYQFERLRADLKALPGSSGSSRPERLVDEIGTRLRRIDPADLEDVTADGRRGELAELLDGLHADLRELSARHHRDTSVAARRHAAAVGARRAPGDAMTTRRYQVTHSTVYGYSDVVTSSYGRGFLTPRDTARQRCLSHALHIDPEPADSSTSRDAYGNMSSYFHVTERHRRLVGHQRVGRRGGSAARGTVRRRIRGRAVGDRASGRPRRRVGDGVHPRPAAAGDHRRGAGLRRAEFEPGRPLIEVLSDLTSRIYRDFTYRSGSTTVSTGVGDVLAAGEGVCQDFARLAIACLRANGLAASYVSGYLATDPPPGKERMVGIDATHAWASVWTPQNQWLGLDPTNDQMVDERYIIVGVGS